MEKIHSFTDLRTWKEAHKLLLMIYKQTNDFPREEQFGLKLQLRRAVVSVTSNIAEGFSRKSSKDKMNFYRMSLSSLTEIQNQILIARDVSYIIKNQFNDIAEQTVTVSKLINGLIKSMNSRTP
jgi:four helix bundle protein